MFCNNYCKKRQVMYHSSLAEFHLQFSLYPAALTILRGSGLTIFEQKKALSYTFHHFESIFNSISDEKKKKKNISFSSQIPVLWYLTESEYLSLSHFDECCCVAGQ